MYTDVYILRRNLVLFRSDSPFAINGLAIAWADGRVAGGKK